jgi:hypothetical protein
MRQVIFSLPTELSTGSVDNLKPPNAIKRLARAASVEGFSPSPGARWRIASMLCDRFPQNARKRQELVEKSIKNLYNALLHRLICNSRKNLRGRFFRSVWTVLS